MLLRRASIDLQFRQCPTSPGLALIPFPPSPLSWLVCHHEIAPTRLRLAGAHHLSREFNLHVLPPDQSQLKVTLSPQQSHFPIQP